MTVDLHHMRQFAVVAEELHFGRAAQRLHMTQPPLSQSIRRLEEALGFKLFERTRRKVELTPAGRVFLEEARRTVTQADEAIRLARRAASDDLAEISLTFVSAALYRVLPAALREYRKRFPQVAIKLDERPTDAQLTDLRAGAVDLGFLHPPLEDAAGLEVRSVHRDTIVAAVSRDSRFATLTTLGLHDLAEEEFVLFPHRQGPVLHNRIVASCRTAGFIPRIAQEARQMHTILSLVAAGMGVSLVPDGARTMRVDGVAFVALNGLPTDLVWELAIAWRPKTARRALREFVRTVQGATRQ